MYVRSVGLSGNGDIARIKLLEGSYPEVVTLYKKLRSGGKLTKTDEWNLNEIMEATGWKKDDVIKDLGELEVNPMEKESSYLGLFNEYYKEACELKEKGFEKYSPQAAEKLWGAITALIKIYAARKGVLLEHWSRGKLRKFVENNVERAKHQSFRDLLTNGNALHEHFYEKSLTEGDFNYHWQKCCELINELKPISQPK